MSINSDTPDEDIEEERRLCYVGITRAKTGLPYPMLTQGF